MKIIINSPIIEFTGPTKLHESKMEYVKWNKKKKLWENQKKIKKKKDYEIQINKRVSGKS